MNLLHTYPLFTWLRCTRIYPICTALASLSASLCLSAFKPYLRRARGDAAYERTKTRTKTRFSNDFVDPAAHLRFMLRAPELTRDWPTYAPVDPPRPGTQLWYNAGPPSYQGGTKRSDFRAGVDAAANRR